MRAHVEVPNLRSLWRLELEGNLANTCDADNIDLITRWGWALCPEGSELNQVTVNQTVWNSKQPNRRPKWNRWNWNWTEPEPSEPDFGVDVRLEN